MLNEYCQRAAVRLHQIEDAVLIFAMSVMVLLATLQIFLRNFFESGITWADPVLRSLVLWLGLLGALLAARSDKHISIDIFSRVLSQRAKDGLAVLTHLFVTFIASVISWNSARLVLGDYQAGTIAFSVVPSWIVQLIIPISFAIIALRYFLLSTVRLQSSLQAKARF